MVDPTLCGVFRLPQATDPVGYPLRLTLYAAVGLVATACHYAMLIALVEFTGLHPGPASSIGAVVGALAAYWGNHRLTFGKAQTPHRRSFPRFMVTAALGALINGFIVGLGFAWGAPYMAVQVLATAAVMGLTYEINRRWTFASAP